MFGFPPPRHTCHLGTSMRTEAELLAARHDGSLEAMADEVGATSLNYITPYMFNQARILIGDLNVLPEEAKGVCMGCVTGVYPVDRFGNFTYEP